MNEVVIIRADSSAGIGTGHVMRTLVLADMMEKSGFRPVYLCRNYPDSLLSPISKAGFTAEFFDSGDESETVINTAKKYSAGWVIIDNYNIGYKDETKIREAGFKIFVIDDNFARHNCNALLNQNIYAEKKDYDDRVPADCKLFTGIEYALLRDEFRNKKFRIRKNTEVNSLLITLGGSDPDNITLKILKNVASQKPDMNITVVAGLANKHIDSLSDFCLNKSNINFIIGADNMAELMDNADAAITAGGATSIEALYAGLPLIVVSIAENQDRMCQALHDKNLAVYAGKFNKDAAKHLDSLVTPKNNSLKPASKTDTILNIFKK